MENHEIPHPRAISVHLILILLTNKECKHANASWMYLDIDAIIYTAKSLERLEGNQFQCTNVRKHCGYIQSIKKKYHFQRDDDNILFVQNIRKSFVDKMYQTMTYKKSK